MDITVIHNEPENRFEAHIGGQIPHVDYFMNGNCMNITHTKVPEALEGQGIAAKLTKEALDYVRNNGLKVRPICPYTQAYINKHPEYLTITI